MKRCGDKKAQSTLEYALIISVCVAAFIGMHMYVRRSMQGQLKQVADGITTQQYNPGRTNSDTTFSTESDTTTESTSELNDAKDRVVTTTTTFIDNEIQTRSGHEDVTE